jgi:hypothetical protein
MKLTKLTLFYFICDKYLYKIKTDKEEFTLKASQKQLS